MTSTATREGRIPALDGIRGVAILLVLAWHYFGSRYVPNHPLLYYLYTPFRMGAVGVDLFFVLSGFLIGGVLLDNRYATNYFQVFYIRRTCRIFPIYYLFLILFFSLNSIIPLVSDSSRLLPTWSYFSYAQNLFMAEHGSFGTDWLGITWSLAVEEHFYLFLPLLIKFTSPRRVYGVLLCLIIMAPTLRFSLPYLGLYREPFLATYILMPCRADSLLLGVLCAHMLRTEKYASAIRNHGWLLYGLLVASILGVRLFRSTVLPTSFVALTFTFFLLLVITRPLGPFRWLVQFSWFRFLGTISYSVYLFHRGIEAVTHYVILGHNRPSIETLKEVFVSLFALVITLLIAYASWIIFEKPIVTFGHRFRYGTVEHTRSPLES